jgi:hypothetical protein
MSTSEVYCDTACAKEWKWLGASGTLDRTIELSRLFSDQESVTATLVHVGEDSAELTVVRGVARVIVQFPRR